MNEPYPGVSRDLFKVARSQVCKQRGLERGREGSRVYSDNQDRSRCSCQIAIRDNLRAAGRDRTYVPAFDTNLDAQDRLEWD